MSIFKDQGNLTILLDTSIDLSSTYKVKILAQAPSGNKKEFVGKVDSTTKIKYIFKPQDLNEVGKWKFQACAEYGTNGYSKSYGNLVTIEVLDNLDEQ